MTISKIMYLCSSYCCLVPCSLYHNHAYFISTPTPFQHETKTNVPIEHLLSVLSSQHGDKLFSYRGSSDNNGIVVSNFFIMVKILTSKSKRLNHERILEEIGKSNLTPGAPSLCSCLNFTKLICIRS